MQKLFLVVLAAAGVFVWLTSGGLPPVVASHLGPGGEANGYMRRATYTLLMLGFVILVPSLVAATNLLVRVLPPQLVNLPNKRYWLAPERRAASLQALGSLSLRFAVALAVFLCFVHWLVVQAHSVQPPRLQESWLFIGLAVLGAATLGWIFSLYRRFGRVP
jgi:serine/threonine-protein kinase